MTIALLILGRKRPGFDPEWGLQMAAAAREALTRAGYDLRTPEAVVADDAGLRRAVEGFRAAGCEALVVLQPTISDGRLAPILGQLWPEPLVLWATPERPEGDAVSSCSLVGAHLFAATLRQLGHPFEVVYGMPGEAETDRQIGVAVRVADAVRRMRQAKVGLIGYHAPGFVDLHPDPARLSRDLGVQLHHFGLHELVERAAGFSGSEVRRDVDAALALGLPMEGVTAEDLPVASRTYLALAAMAAEENLDALALRDWPELPNVMEQWPYLAVVRLLAEGLPVAAEGDVDGALSCLMGQLLGAGTGCLFDWLEHRADAITLWHAGDAAPALCPPVGSPGGPRLARHFNNDKPIVVDAELRAGEPVTLFRLWRCDDAYHLAALQGETLPPARRLQGSHGVVRLEQGEAHACFERLCHAGMPHHLAVVAGHHGDALRRLARAVGVRWVSLGAQASE